MTMLLTDDAVKRQFAVITRVAQLLQQVTVMAAVPDRAFRSTAGSEVGGIASITAPGPTFQREQSFHLGEATRPRSESYHSVRSGKEGPADGSILQKPLTLPRVNGEVSISLLYQLGKILEEATTQLQNDVDAQLVDFYAYLKEKAEATLPSKFGLTDRASPLRAAGNPNCMPTPPSRALAQRQQLVLRKSSSLMPSSVDRDRRIRHPSVFLPVVISSEVENTEVPRRSLVDTEATGYSEEADSSSKAGVVSILRSSGAGTVPNSNGLGSSSISLSVEPPPPSRGFHSVCNSLAAMSNTPKARRLDEERAAATELQSFFALLLGAAQRLTGATAAAVYIDDVPAPNAATDGPAGHASSGASASGHGRAQFLHCIAHSRGHFPPTISCAVTNVLTTVAATGVAVNVQYSESSLLHQSSRGLPDSSGVGFALTRAPAQREGGAPENGDKARNSVFHIFNGVVVPLKGMGCLVLANKAKSTVPEETIPHFSISDEHVAWSAGLLCEAVLQQHERQLLLRVAWAPSCVAALRPFLRTNGYFNDGHAALTGTSLHGGVDGASTRQKKPVGRRDLKRAPSVRVAAAPAADTVKKWTDKEVDNNAVSALVFDPQNDIFSKTLTIVRTNDPLVAKALPSELRSASFGSPFRRGTTAVLGNASAAATSAGAPSSTRLNDEEVFQAAAQYITNLESLWRKTIAESNTMHAVVESYNKEIRKQEETIAVLESKVRELTTHVALLERRANVSRLNVAP